MVIEIESDKYIITGLPFYNYDNENAFKEALEDTLNDLVAI
jgi:type III restriction enzyme